MKFYIAVLAGMSMAVAHAMEAPKEDVLTFKNNTGRTIRFKFETGLPETLSFNPPGQTFESIDIEKNRPEGSLERDIVAGGTVKVADLTSREKVYFGGVQFDSRREYMNKTCTVEVRKMLGAISYDTTCKVGEKTVAEVVEEYEVTDVEPTDRVAWDRLGLRGIERPEPHQILGVSKDASPDEIKKKWMQLSRKWGQDRAPVGEYQSYKRIQQMINDANQKLTEKK